MQIPYIEAPAVAYFHDQELHLFFLCTEKEKGLNRKQYIVEREQGGYATVWPSRCRYLHDEEQSVDSTVFRSLNDAVSFARVGVYTAYCQQCYTPQQALEEIGYDPESFCVERIGYHQGIRQVRAKLFPEDTKSTPPDTVRAAKAIISAGITKQKHAMQSVLTLAERQTESHHDAGAKWIGNVPFTGIAHGNRVDGYRIGREYYDNDEEF